MLCLEPKELGEEAGRHDQVAAFLRWLKGKIEALEPNSFPIGQVRRPDGWSFTAVRYREGLAVRVTAPEPRLAVLLANFNLEALPEYIPGPGRSQAVLLMARPGSQTFE